MGSSERNEQVNVETASQSLEWVHVHIPKTAGITTLRALVDKYGGDKVLRYDAALGRAIQSNKQLIPQEQNSVRNRVRASAASHPTMHRLIRPIYSAVKNKIERHGSIDPAALAGTDFMALSGHFDWQKIHEWGLENGPTFTVVRHPLERAWSHFQHWKRSGGFARGRSNLPYASGVTFETFAMDKPSINYQSQFVGNLTMKHIGVTDNLPDMFEEMGLQIDHARPLHLNQGSYEDLPTLDKDFVKVFTDLNQQDYELYHRARDSWS